MCGLTPTPLQLSRPQYRNLASLSREECRKGVGADLAKHPDFPAGSHRIALVVAVASSRNLIFGNAQHVSNLLRVNDQLWVWQGRRPHLHVVARLDLARVLQGKKYPKAAKADRKLQAAPIASRGSVLGTCRSVSGSGESWSSQD